MTDETPIIPTFPMDKLPPLGPLPEGSSIPLVAGSHFLGRDVELLLLAQVLGWSGERPPADEVPVVVVSGPDGVGKSQLAAEFAHSFGRFFPGGVQWVSMADPASVAAGAASCGLWMDLDRRYAALSLAEQVALVKRAWAGPQPRLLVFDNCADEGLLAEWRPAAGGSRVLVTGRQAGWDVGPERHLIPLQPLARSDSAAVLSSFAPWLKPVEADEIAAELEDLPLALHLAGSYLSVYTVAVEVKDYLAELRTAGKEGWDSVAGYDDPVARAFAVSYARIGPADTVARNLLARLACLAWGEPVPQSLVVAIMSGSPAENKRPMAPKTIVASLRRLSRLGLLTMGERRVGIGEEFIPDFQSPVIMHRLLGRFASQQIELNTIRPAVEMVVAQEARRVNESGLSAPLLAWVVHLRVVAREAERWGSGLAGVLEERLARHMQMVGGGE